MIAFMLFSVFYLAFVGSQSDNVLDSEYMESELMLHSLCKNVLNDILIAPPTLTESLTLTAQKERFEDSDLQDFEYMVEWVQFELPNFFNLAGGGQDDEGNSGQNAQMQQYMNVMYESIKENVKQALWQVRVTVFNKITDNQYTMTAWLRNPNYQIKAMAGQASAPTASEGE